ncbi:unnamed protein product [Polarella glacialis]|uniref:Adenine DNA glycosylase n=1 Tax=Polarella glacialis TaxID=89957 RepID=A0A813IGA0_POLGL|nr:unnamed protein product [Polarella glacialis]
MARPSVSAHSKSDVEDLARSDPGGWKGDEFQIRRELLSWYGANRRRLPWRGDPPPWSEDKAALRREASDLEEQTQAQHGQKPLTSFFRQLQPLPSRSTGKPVSMGSAGRSCGSVNGSLTDGRVVIDLDSDGECSQQSSVSRDTVLPTDSKGQGVTKSPGADDATFPSSAYGTWVSEVMLQQTQVERVVAYWTEWMRLFPTVKDLAEASPDAVNAAWAGLGFYGRARRLHEGAKYLVAEHAGVVPDSLEQLLRIPGVGPYTAGAIASIAFGQPAALVDGNVIRVFARLRALAGDSASAVLSRRCWALAHELVDLEQPGSFNQALMELGATVCTPQAPACSRCPLQVLCLARRMVADGKAAAVTDFPARPSKKAPRARLLAVAAVESVENGVSRWLLARRASTGLLAGQWEFPCVELVGAEIVDSASSVTSMMQASASASASASTSTSASASSPSSSSAPSQAKRAAKRPAVASLTSAELHKSEVDLSQLLRSLVPDLPTTLSLRHSQLPPLEHVFSHERHTMHIFRMIGQVDAAGVSLADTVVRQTAWMTAEESKAAGATSGLSKVFAALLKANVSEGPAPKKKTPEAKSPKTKLGRYIA